MFKGLFKKTSYITVSTQELDNIKKSEQEDSKPNIPNGMWIKCQECGNILYKDDVNQNFYTCSNCSHHFRLNARDRIDFTVDKGTFKEFNSNMKTFDPLKFPGYKDKVENQCEKTNLKDAVVTGYCKIENNDCIICVMDSNFIMGSMGCVVGEKLTIAFEKAIEEKLPVIIFTASGGARMQEGIYSLMQMAKVSAAAAKHSEEGLLYITVLTDPTTGGVTASFAMLADIILAEPNALIGFAGQRVIQQTIGEELPKGFQRAEFLLKHGFVDKIVERNKMRSNLAKLLAFHKR